MESILNDLTKYRKKIDTNRNNIFQAIDTILNDVKDTNQQIKKIGEGDDDYHGKSVKAILKVKK